MVTWSVILLEGPPRWLASAGCSAAGVFLSQLPHSSLMLSVIEMAGLLSAILSRDVLIIDLLCQLFVQLLQPCPYLQPCSRMANP